MMLRICRINRTGKKKLLKDKASEDQRLENILNIQARKHIAPLQRKLKCSTIPPKLEPPCRPTEAQVILLEPLLCPQKLAPKVELKPPQQIKPPALK
jgi:hypothetical protein